MRHTIAVLLSVLGFSFSAAAPVPAEGCFRVVVHRDHPAPELELSKLERMFLKKTQRWPDGTEVIPVDQEPDSAVRADFSRAVFGKSVTAIRSYWQRLIFSGRGVPPVELDGDQAVLDFVRRQPAAIGYVSCGYERVSGVTLFHMADSGKRPVLLAGPRGARLMSDPHDAAGSLTPELPSPVRLATTASSRDHAGILRASDCQAGGHHVFVQNRREHDAKVHVEHRITAAGRLRFQGVRILDLPAGGRRYLGCSKDGDVDHSFALGESP